MKDHLLRWNDCLILWRVCPNLSLFLFNCSLFLVKILVIHLRGSLPLEIFQIFHELIFDWIWGQIWHSFPFESGWLLNIFSRLYLILRVLKGRNSTNMLLRFFCTRFSDWIQNWQILNLKWLLCQFFNLFTLRRRSHPSFHFWIVADLYHQSILFLIQSWHLGLTWHFSYHFVVWIWSVTLNNLNTFYLLFWTCFYRILLRLGNQSPFGRNWPKAYKSF